MRSQRVTTSSIIVICSLIGLVGCGGLQQAESVPVIESASNTDPDPGNAAVEVAQGDAKTAAATLTQRQRLTKAQRAVDASYNRRPNPGMGSDAGSVFMYVPKGKENLLHVRLRMRDEDGDPILDEQGNPMFEDKPEVTLVQWRSSGQPYAPTTAWWMYPEDYGMDQLPANMQPLHLAPSNDAELQGVNGHDMWYAIIPSKEVSAAIAAGIPMRLRFEDEEGNNALFTSETFGPNSTALALSADEGVRWDIMATDLPSGERVHDPVLVNPTARTREFILRGRHQDEEQGVE